VFLCFRLIAVEFARSPIRFLDRKTFDMGIAGDKPRHSHSSSGSSFSTGREGTDEDLVAASRMTIPVAERAAERPSNDDERQEDLGGVGAEREPCLSGG
jgi:hypothetical protein